MEKRSKYNLHFLPEDYQKHILFLKEQEGFSFSISNPRATKLGDYRYNYRSKRHHITVNIDLEPIYFLITYLHEVAHKMCQDQFGRSASPHGKEWKSIFVSLLWNAKMELNHSTENQEILLGFIANPKARFQKHRKEKGNVTVDDLTPNTIFELEKGRIFKIIHKRRTRYLCEDIKTKKQYTVIGSAEVKNVISNG